jgi:nucleoside-diphosphate-sugar epimerase
LKRILIIGGTGFIGYHLARYCLKKNFFVTSVSKNLPNIQRFIKGIKYILCDISDKKLLKIRLKDNFDYVVNLSGYVNHKNKKETYKSHYLGARNLGNFFLKKKIKKFIQVGSSMEYGRASSPQKETLKCNPQSIYGTSKLLATQYFINLFLKKNFPVTILRLYQVYGPKQDLNRLIPIVINSCKENKNFPCSNGKQFRDFLYIDDLVRAIFISLNKKKSVGKIINIGSGHPLKIKDVITKIVHHFGIGKPLFGTIKLRKEELLRVFPDLENSKKYLNWQSKINFKSGLKKTMNFYDKKKY